MPYCIIDHPLSILGQSNTIFSGGFNAKVDILKFRFTCRNINKFVYKMTGKNHAEQV